MGVFIWFYRDFLLKIGGHTTTAPLGVHCSLFKNVSIQCVNLSFCVITGTLRDEGVDSVLKEKSRRLQITLKENIIADLDAVSRKYGLSKSNIIAMLSNKYLKIGRSSCRDQMYV